MGTHSLCLHLLWPGLQMGLLQPDTRLCCLSWVIRKVSSSKTTAPPLVSTLWPNLTDTKSIPAITMTVYDCFYSFFDKSFIGSKGIKNYVHMHLRFSIKFNDFRLKYMYIQILSFSLIIILNTGSHHHLKL